MLSAESTAAVSVPASHLFTGPRDLPPFAREEFDALSRALCRRLKDGSLPPDDAYWWVRTLCSEAHLLAAPPEPCG